MKILKKEETIINFIKNIVNNEPPECINQHRDFIIKALRLFYDAAFWEFYSLHQTLREKGEYFVNVYLSQEQIDFLKYGENYLEIMENIPILDKISKIIGNDENVPEFERLEMLSAIVHSKENYHRLKDKDALINKLLNDDNELMVAPSVKTFCKNSKHDVIVLGGLIEKLVYYNELPETLQACHTIVCYEDDELQKYKCRLIKLNHNNHVAFIKIYKNTKKQNIIDFTDLKLKEIELYFGEGKQYKRLGLPENSLDKYKKIELNNETKNFARDLNIYYLALQGNNDKDISALLELDYGFDFASIRRIISDINKLVKHNYLSNID